VGEMRKYGRRKIIKTINVEVSVSIVSRAIYFILCNPVLLKIEVSIEHLRENLKIKEKLLNPVENFSPA
jgi:hypothetical protein